MPEFTKLSSRGQVVIPQAVRDQLRLEEGAQFLVVAQDDSILLKKLKTPDIKSWKEITKPFRQASEKSGFSEKDLENLISEVRKSK